MTIEVELPELGEDAGDQATVAEWHFEEGEHILEGEELMEVATEDDTVQVPCPVAGILIEKLVAEGDLVRLVDPLAIVESTEEAHDFALLEADDV